MTRPALVTVVRHLSLFFFFLDRITVLALESLHPNDHAINFLVVSETQDLRYGIRSGHLHEAQTAGATTSLDMSFAALPNRGVRDQHFDHGAESTVVALQDASRLEAQLVDSAHNE